MKVRIFTKLFIAMLLGVAIPLAAMMASVHWTFRQGFEDYLHRVELERLDQLIALLATEYREHGDWDFLAGDRRRWFGLLWRGLAERPSGARDGGIDDMPGWPPEADPPALPPPPPPPDDTPASRPRAHGHFRHRPPPDPLLLGLRLVLLDAQQRPVIRPPARRPGDPDQAQHSLLPIESGDAVVGWLQVRRRTLLTDRLALAFIDQQSRSNAMILLLALVLSALGSWLLARQLIRPVRRIAAGIRKLASGDYTVQIPAGGDELGDLARDFNLLGRTLQRNEAARRDWIADISHELRTPLAVLRGEVEAMQDGLRPFSADGVSSLHAEVLALGKLVDDLYELSLSDLGALDYRREPVALAEVVDEAVQGFEHRFERKGVGLSVADLPPAIVRGDRRRLGQLVGNLLENSYRYTDRGGRCEVRLETTPTRATLFVDDSPPGVPEALLGKLFERLFRVDRARTRGHGGAGLGLAICRNIVDAHGGRISAHASPLGGLQIRVELSREPD